MASWAYLYTEAYLYLANTEMLKIVSTHEQGFPRMHTAQLQKKLAWHQNSTCTRRTVISNPKKTVKYV